MSRVQVAGVDRLFLNQGGMSVKRVYNERSTAKITFQPGYTPTLLQEVTIYAADNVTPIFGGVIHDIDATKYNNEGLLTSEVECVDWWAYLDWVLVNGGYLGPLIEISSSNAGNPVVVNTAVAHNLQTGDTVLITDHPGFAAGNAYTVTRIDADSFSVAQAGPGGGAVGHVQRAMVVSVKRVLSDLVVFYLAAYGISLDAAQEDGPSGAHQGLDWKYKFASDVIRDLTNLSGLASGVGWVARISPTKVLRMVNPTLATPNAPFELTTANSHNVRMKWQKTLADYGNRVVLKCGGDKTAQVTQSVTLTSQHIAQGFFDVFAPSTPTGGVTAKLNNVSKTIGGAGNQLIWTWNGGVEGRGRVTAGTVTPVAGDLLEVTFTAQFPFYVEAATGGSPVITRYYEFEDIVDLAAATTMKDSLLAKISSQPYEIEFDTMDAGLEPGQILTINLPSMGINTSGFILEVESMVQERLWAYRVKVNTAAITKNPLDTFRNFIASGGGGQSRYTGGFNTSVIQTIGRSTYPLGGSGTASIGGAADTPLDHPDAIPVQLDTAALGNTTCTALITCRAATPAGGVTPEIWDMSGPTLIAAGSIVNGTTWTTRIFAFTPASGQRFYQMRLRPSNSSVPVQGQGYVEIGR